VRVVDFGFVGDVKAVDPAALAALENGYVPVLASLGADETADPEHQCRHGHAVLAAERNPARLIADRRAGRAAHRTTRHADPDADRGGARRCCGRHGEAA
jgi:hypothetical protein